jgi:hypothetical protein
LRSRDANGEYYPILTAHRRWVYPDFLTNRSSTMAANHPTDSPDTNASQSDAERLASPVLTPIEARQGVISGRIVTVLGVSISLALLAMVVSYMIAT